MSGQQIEVIFAGEEDPSKDCSCRGGSGWAHFPCIVDYAKQNSDQWDGWDPNKFAEPWKVCPSCKQSYQNTLSFDLANEFVSFVEEKYPDDKLKHLAALRRKLVAGVNEREEAKQIANKILSIIEQVKKRKTYEPSCSSRMDSTN